MDERKRKSKHGEKLKEQLYQPIGKFKTENDWPIKDPDLTTEKERMLVDKDHPILSIAHPCPLPGLSRPGVTDKCLFPLTAVILPVRHRSYTCSSPGGLVVEGPSNTSWFSVLTIRATQLRIERDIEGRVSIRPPYVHLPVTS